MIITTQKPLDVILDYISPYNKLLIVGCDGCTQPPRGLREAKTLSQLLELGGKLRNKNFTFKVTTMAKQCDSYLVSSMLKPQMDGVEAVLSLACGIGVQVLAGLSSEIPVFPTQDTHFMGAEEREGDFALFRRQGGRDPAAGHPPAAMEKLQIRIAYRGQISAHLPHAVQRPSSRQKALDFLLSSERASMC